LQNIGDGRFVDAEAHISQSHFESLRSHEVLAGDLLIASLGESPPRACLAPARLGPAIVKADCIRVRLSMDVDPRWVLYAMQTPAVRRWAAERMYGVGRPRLGLKTIRAIPLPLPPLQEQRRIVEILEDHVSRLDAAEHLLAASRQRSAALRRSSLDRIVRANSSVQASLRDVVDRIEAGRSFGGSAPPASDGEWGVIKVSAMTWGRFKPEENKAVSGDRVDARFEIHSGDVLVSRANTSEYVGAPVLVASTRPRLLLSDKSLRLVPKDGVDPRWLVAVLAAPATRHQISARATGTKDSMRNISQEVLLSVTVPVATEQEQSRIVALVRLVDDAVAGSKNSVEIAARRSGLLRGALLAAAFSGQLTGERATGVEIEEFAGV
jgi:type I restriction enzyme, S subunit